MLIFPVASEETQWELTEAQIAQWQEIYPQLDVLQECRHAWAWIDANPRKRKKANGMKKFLVGWLNRAKPMRKVETFTMRPDQYGHFPPCQNMQDCTRRVLAEAREKREQV